MVRLSTIAFVFSLLATPSWGQSSADIPIEQAGAVATQALRANEPALALEIARRVLEVNPDDRLALLVVAAAGPNQGAATEARQAGARAFGLAETNGQKYEAARLTALAATREERFTLATYWLRRALVVAPNSTEKDRTLRDARSVSRANPWSTTLSFSIAPSNNVNGGAEDEDAGEFLGFTGTLSADAVAQPGKRANLSFGTSYRFYQTPRSRARVGVNYQLARVRLDDETPDDPRTGEEVELDSSDFDTDYAQINLSYDHSLERGTIGLSLATGFLEFGHERYYDFDQLGISRTIPLNDQWTLFANARREWYDFESETISDALRNTVRGGLAYRFANGDVVTGAYTRLRANSDTSTQDFEQRGIDFSYRFGEPLGPFSIRFNVGARRAEYEFYSFFGPREDETVSYGINVGVPAIEFAGFQPTIAITGSRTDSNIARFTRSNFSVLATIESAF